MTNIGTLENIEKTILFVRGQKVILDTELAKLYGVTTKRLNEQVHRNLKRFPSDFMFRFELQELINLRSQIATSSLIHGGRRYLPFVFTEYGAIMAANVLNSERAIEVSVLIVRAFVKLREISTTHKEFAKKLTELEQKLGTHDKAIRSLFTTIRELMTPPLSSKRKIGFRGR